MGPRSIERGNTGPEIVNAGSAGLQWGRARLSAEIVGGSE